MSRIVCYIPSYNDSELVAESLATVPEWEVVISDNASAPDHAEALDRMAGQRVRVIHQPRQLGRVGNWKFCVSHFIESGAAWMKFLPAGDRHKPDSLAICRRALAEHPLARSIVFNVEIVAPEGRSAWSTAEGMLVLEPAQAMLEVVQRSNVFYGLVSALVHAEAVRGGFTFADEVLSYCADMFFQVNIARRNATYFIPQTIAEFVEANRKMYKVGQYSLEHLIEDGLVRLRAADYYAELTGDRETRDRLVPLLAVWLRGGLAQPLEKLLGARG
jgi:hypothetical protein